MEPMFALAEIGPRPAGVPRGHWWCQVEPVGSSGVDMTLALPIAGTRGEDYVTRYCYTPDGWAYPCAEAVVAAQEDLARWVWEPGAWQVGPGSLWVPDASTLASLYPSTETGLWAEILGTVGTIGGAFVGGAGAPVGGAAGAALGAGIDAATAEADAPEGSRFSYIPIPGRLPPGAVRYSRIADPVQRRAIFDLATTLARRDLQSRRNILGDPWDPANAPSPSELERLRSEILRTYAVVPRSGASATQRTAQDAATAAALLAAAAQAIAGAARPGASLSGGPSSRPPTPAGASQGAAGSSSGADSAARLLALLGGLAGAAGSSSGSSSPSSSAPVSPQTAATVLAALQQLAGGQSGQGSTGGSAAGATALAGLLRSVLGGS